MLSSKHFKKASRLDRSSWLVQALHCYLVSSQRNADHMIVTVGRIESPDPETPMMVIVEEVWSGTVNTIQPTKTLHSLVNDFLHCEYLNHPVEMAYDWGGLVNHRKLAVTNQHREPLQ